MSKKKVIVITGPTAIGKTEISLLCAKLYNGQIINADASQFRRDLNIGTAKIDISKTRIAHHLIDILDINDSFSIKDYQELARNKINELHEKNILPFLVGGSGLYINSVIEDYLLNDPGRDIFLEEEIYKDFDNLTLHQKLESLDLKASKEIHPNNRRRVLRAIQKAKAGKTSFLDQENTFIYDVLTIQLTSPRAVLYARINNRFELMIANGWLKEVVKLKEQGYDLSKIKDIGYKELSLYLDGKMNYEDTASLIKQKTRNYAKRQITWFKNKLKTVEVEMDYNDPNNNLQEIKNLIDKFLGRC